MGHQEARACATASESSPLGQTGEEAECWDVVVAVVVVVAAAGAIFVAVGAVVRRFASFDLAGAGGSAESLGCLWPPVPVAAVEAAAAATVVPSRRLFKVVKATRASSSSSEHDGEDADDEDTCTGD